MKIHIASLNINNNIPSLIYLLLLGKFGFGEDVEQMEQGMVMIGDSSVGTVWFSDSGYKKLLKFIRKYRVKDEN